MRVEDRLLRVCCPLLSHIRIGTINDELHTAFLAGELLAKDDGEICLLITNHAFGFLWGGNGFYNRKVFRLRESLNSLMRSIVSVGHDHNRTHVPHVVGYGEAKE